LPPPLPWPTEEQDVAVRVANFEAAKTIVGILERHAECRSMIGKFDGQRIRVWCIDAGVPPQVAMALGVRQRRDVFPGLDEDLRTVATDDGGKRVLIRLLESGLKAELVAVKSDGLLDVAYDRRTVKSPASLVVS
jgi:hypothetical protein